MASSSTVEPEAKPESFNPVPANADKILKALSFAGGFPMHYGKGRQMFKAKKISFFSCVFKNFVYFILPFGGFIWMLFVAHGLSIEFVM